MAIEPLNNLPEHLIDHAALGVKSQSELDDRYVNISGDTMSGQLTSTLAIGTSPFAVTSTTVNTNLNADLWDGYQFSDYLDQAVKVASSPTFAGLNVTSSMADFDVGYKVATGQQMHLYNTADETTNFQRLEFKYAAGVAYMNTMRGGSGGIHSMAFTVQDGLAMSIGNGGVVRFFGQAQCQQNIHMDFGSGAESGILWSTVGNDALRIITTCNSATGSGNIIICEKADVATDFGHATTVDPTLIIQSADATTVTDYIKFYHDQTDANIRVGGGNLKLNVPTGATFEWSVNDIAQAVLSSTALTPATDASIALGTTTLGFNGLHLNTATAINWENGNVVLTHSTNGLNLTANSVVLADLTSTGYVFNEGGADIDMRWESDTNANLLNINAGENAIHFLSTSAVAGTTSHCIVNSPANATETYTFYVDRETNTIPVPTEAAITRWGAWIGTRAQATTSTTYANNVTGFSVRVDQSTIKGYGATWDAGNYNQTANAFTAQVRVNVGQTGTGWSTGQSGNPFATAGQLTIQDYYGNTSDIPDTRLFMYGLNCSVAGISYTLNNAAAFIQKNYYGGYFEGNNRVGTLTAGTITKNTIGGYFVAQADALGTSTQYAGQFVQGGTPDTAYGCHIQGSLFVTTGGVFNGIASIDMGLTVNETGADSDTRIEGDTATNLLVLDAGLDAVQIGTTTAGVIADFRSSVIVLNEDGSDRDIRFEGDTDVNLFYCDASTDRIGLGTNAPATKLDIASDSFRITGMKTPASAADTGVQGQICWDTNYVYVCVATNTWKRAGLATW